jgi:hypothetical protein
MKEATQALFFSIFVMTRQDWFFLPEFFPTLPTHARTREGGVGGGVAPIPGDSSSGSGGESGGGDDNRLYLQQHSINHLSPAKKLEGLTLCSKLLNGSPPHDPRRRR